MRHRSSRTNVPKMVEVLLKPSLVNTQVKMVEVLLKPSLVNTQVKTNGNRNSRRTKVSFTLENGRDKVVSHLRNTVHSTVTLSSQWSSARSMLTISCQTSTVESDTYWQVSKIMTLDCKP
jgi:hypothetical protein